MIAHDLKSDMLTPEFIECIKRSSLEDYVEMKDLEIIGVVNTENGEVIDLKKAEEANLIDLKLGIFHDILNDKWIPLKQAILQGLVVSKKNNYGCYADRFYVDYVKVGNDQRKIDLKEAISEKYINPLENIYYIPEENIEMNLIEAVMCGMIKIIETPKEDTMNYERFIILFRKINDPKMEELCQYEIKNLINVKMLKIAQESNCWNEFLEVRDEKERIMESLYKDHLYLDPFRCGYENKESVLIACVKGYISPEKMRDLLLNMKESFIGEKIDDLDKISTGKDIFDKLQTMPDINKKDAFIISCDQLNIMSVDKLNDEINEKLFITKIDVDDIEKKLIQLSKLKEMAVDTDTNVIANTEEDKHGVFSITLVEAVMNDILILDTLEIMNKSDKEMYNLEESVEKWMIDEKAGKDLLDYVERLSFDKLIEDGIFIVESNSFGKEGSLLKAIEDNLVKPELVYLIVPEKEEFVNLSKLMKIGILNAVSNEVTMENKGNEIITMKLSEAFNNEYKMICGNIDVSEIKKRFPKKLKDLKEEFKLNYKKDKIRFSDIEIEEMRIYKALELGLVCEDSRVKLCEGDNIEIKSVLFCDDIELISLVNEVNKMMDKLTIFDSESSHSEKFTKAQFQEDLESDRIEKLEITLFNLLEEEQVLEDKIENFTDSVKTVNFNVNPIQFSFLVAQMENVKNLSSKISHDLQRSQNVLLKEDVLTSITSVQDTINQLKLHLNNINRDLQKTSKLKTSSLYKNILIQDLNDKYQRLKEYKNEISVSSPKYFELKECIVKLFDRNRRCEDGNMLKKISNLEKELIELKKFRENVFSDNDALMKYFGGILDNFNSIEHSICSIEQFFKEAEIKLSEETKCIPLTIQLLDIKLEIIYKLKRDISNMQPIVDKLEKNIGDDLKSSQLYLPLQSRITTSLESVIKLKNEINIKQKELSETKIRINEMKLISKGIFDKEKSIEKNLSEVKLKDKMDLTFQSTIDIRKQFMETMDNFEQLINSCEYYLNNNVYVNKDKILSMCQDVIQNQRELYEKINEELVSQVESNIGFILVELERLQIFALDLPKSWNTNFEDVTMKRNEINNYLEYLRDVKIKLQNMNQTLEEDIVDQFDMDFDNLESAIVKIRLCEKERLASQLNFEHILDIVSNSYLPTIISYDNNTQLVDTALKEITQNINVILEEFNAFTADSSDKSDCKFSNFLNEKKDDLQNLNEQLMDLESVIETIESNGFDIIEQLINLNTHLRTESNVLRIIRDEIELINQRFKEAKISINDIEIKINNFITPTSKSLNEQINNEINSWRVINDAFNRLDPIQSRPEKIKEQEFEISNISDEIKEKESRFLLLKQSFIALIPEASEEDNVTETSLDDIYNVINNNPSTFESQETTDTLKDIEVLIESIFFKVEHRASTIKDLLDISNKFWPDITSLNNTITDIYQTGILTEVFPNISENITETLTRQLSGDSESLCDNRSSAASVDLDAEDKLDENLCQRKDFNIILEGDENNYLNVIKNESSTSAIKPELVYQQNERLKKMDATVEECIVKLQTDLEPKAVQIIKTGGQSCAFEVNDYLESVWENVGAAQDILGEKHIEIDKGLYLVNFLVDELKIMAEWFPSIENRLSSVNDVTPDQKMIELNLHQLKTLDAEVFSQFNKMEKLASTLKEILSYPYVPNKSILEEIKKNIDDRYSELVNKIIMKHNELQAKYTEIGELDFVLEDNIGIMQELENQIKHFSRQTSKGDPQFTSSCLKNLKLLSKAFEKQQIVIENLNEVVAAYKDTNVNTALKARGCLTIFGKLKELNDLSHNIQEIIPEKKQLLEEILKNEKLVSKDIHKFIDYLDIIKGIFKHSPKIGLTKESVNQFSSYYMNYIKELNDKEESIKTSIEMVNTIIGNCPYERCSSLTTAVKTLSYKHKRCHQLALKRKDRLNNYSRIIIDFDTDKITVFKTILELENISLTKAYPSKITRTCAEQIKFIKINIEKTEKCIDVLESLNIRSFEMKSFGNNFDNSQLHLEFRDNGLKLAKIQKCLRERLRIFIQGFKEDKLFSDSYDDLNNWLDCSYIMVESFKQDPSKVQDHLDKLKKLCQQLSAQYANFHCTVRYGTYLKDRCLEKDPEKGILVEMLMNLKNKWIKIRNLIISEKTSLNRKMIETGNLNDAIKSFSYWINEIISKFDPKMKLYGDLDTVEVLTLDCQSSVEEADNHLKDFGTLKKRMLKEIKNYNESDIRNKIMDIEAQFMDYLSSLNARKAGLKESLDLAKEFNNKLDDIRLWSNKAEKQLKLKSLPKFENEAELIDLIKNHEFFLKRLNDMKIITNDMTNISKIILGNCHSSAKNYVSRIMFSIGNRFNQIQQRAEARSKKLNEALGTLRGSSALIEELIQKVANYLNKMREVANSKLPLDVESTNILNNNHITFHNEIIEMDTQIKDLIKEFKIRNPSCSNLTEKVLRYKDRAEFYKSIWRNSRDNINRTAEELTSNGRLNLLNSQFNVLWKLSVERKSALQSMLINLNEQELLKKFDFNTWRGDFTNFVKNKGLRLTDLFRKQSVKRTGFLNEVEFISCITKSGFNTNKSVLKEVFQIFNRNNDNMISYQEFIDAMRPERRSIDTKYKNVNLDDKKAVLRIIHDIIEREVAVCTCKQRFFVKKEGENKYRFGNNSKMYMVRYLNSSVMVRIGGGWQNLTEFLSIHDPCRGERTSVQMSAGDQQKLKGLKLPSPTDNKTGSLTVTHTRTQSLIENKLSVNNNPKVSRISNVTQPSELQERAKKDQLPSKPQPSKVSKLTKKK